MKQLSDEERWGIHDLQARYVIALDSGDVEAVAAQFVDDAVFETHHHRFVGPDGIRKMLRHAPKGLHLGGHATVQAADFGAIGRQQLVFIDATDHTLRLALYDDEMVKIGDVWQFRRRLCQFMLADGSLNQNPPDVR